MQTVSLLTPPIAFAILIGVCSLISMLFSKCAYRSTENRDEGKKGYACGENFTDNMIQPDYSQFFPFAFFFTILHVIALTITTVPAGNSETFAIAATYITAAVLGLSILFRS